MLAAETSSKRRLIGRLDRGVELGAALIEVCRHKSVRCGEVRAVGHLEDAVVHQFDPRAQRFSAPQRFDTPFELLQLQGSLSEKEGKLHLSAHVALSRQRDSGLELLGGHLVSARVLIVEFFVDAIDDLLLRRTRHACGLDVWNEAIALDRSASPIVESAPSAPSWQAVQEASQVESPAKPAGPAEIERRVGPGDLIEHPKFGRCQVERLEGDYEFVSVRLRNQRLIRLSLDVLALEWIGEADGHQLFSALAPS